MRVIVVRHAEKSANLPSSPLTASGRDSAVETGEWLRAYGVVPVLVAHSNTVRTRETAEYALSAFGLNLLSVVPRVLLPEPMPGSPNDWAKRMRQVREALNGVRMVEHLEGDAILFVHRATQYLVQDAYGGAAFLVPRENRGCAYVLDVPTNAQEARCVAAWPGHPKLSRVPE